MSIMDKSNQSLTVKLEKRLSEAELALGMACRIIEKHIHLKWYEIEQRLLEFAMAEISKDKIQNA